MISKADLAEATNVLRAVLARLALLPKSDTGAAGANLTFAISTLRAGASQKIAAGSLGRDLLACFSLAIAAGATMPQMLAIYATAGAFLPVGRPGRSVVAACQSFAVVAMARILSATTFVSRDDVDAAMAQIGAVFDMVEGAAGNTLQTELYQALVTLHAAVTADLTTRSYPLPRMVSYSFPRTFSALALAHRLYGDASRAREVAQENRVFNPAFMPLAGRVLSA